MTFFFTIAEVVILGSPSIIELFDNRAAWTSSSCRCRSMVARSVAYARMLSDPPAANERSIAGSAAEAAMAAKEVEEEEVE